MKSWNFVVAQCFYAAQKRYNSYILNTVSYILYAAINGPLQTRDTPNSCNIFLPHEQTCLTAYVVYHAYGISV